MEGVEEQQNNPASDVMEDQGPPDMNLDDVPMDQDVREPTVDNHEAPIMRADSVVVNDLVSQSHLEATKYNQPSAFSLKFPLSKPLSKRNQRRKSD
jgi:hypothetical protein